MQHALSIDVEEHFQVNAFADVIDPEQWPQQPSRVVENTQRLMDLLAEREVSATFFVLGWVAQRHPELVREIAARGHEVACHGFSHQLVYRQSPEVFREETRRSKGLLEDATGAAVLGYRAASYSITRASLWALDVLVEEGFQYDSSIFPIRHDTYGIPDAPRTPHRLTLDGGGDIVEFPLSTCRIAGVTLPVAGGGYFRLYPYWLSRWLMRRSHRQTAASLIFYLHPWEVDPNQPAVDGAGWRSRFRHYNNLHKCEARLRQLLSEFDFTTVAKVLAARSELVTVAARNVA